MLRLLPKAGRSPGQMTVNSIARFRAAYGLKQQLRQSARCLQTRQPSQEKPELIIFDKDGTLICFHSLWAPWVEDTTKRFERKTGLNLEAKIHHLFKYNQAERKILPGLLAEETMPIIKRQLEKLLQGEGLDFDRSQEIVDECYHELETIDTNVLITHGNVNKLMTKLKEHGIKIAVCTADSRKGTINTLKEMEVDHLVDMVVCSDDPGMIPKPNAHNAFAICEKLDVELDRTVMVGDTMTDMKFGINAGLGNVVGVLSGVSTEGDLCESADHVIDDIQGLTSLFLKSSPGTQHTNLPRKPHHGPFNTPARSFSTSSPAHSEQFSHVIVGAGSAGCLLANRLTEDSTNNVMLLEAGPKDYTWKIHMPAALVYPLCNDKYNWFYNTIPQKYMNNREMYCPRGRVWGGSSSLNAMCYVRGHALDYDRWQKEGAEGWSYADCLPYFKKAQSHELGEDKYRGGSGPLHVSRGKTKNPLFAAFLEAGHQAGYPLTNDYNGYQQEGFDYMDLTIHKGIRWSTANAYLRPALKRNNLKVTSKTLTTRVLFEGSKAVGVEYKQGGQLKTVRADKVILSAGSINTPQLLMLSGVGNADDLKKHGIPLVNHLPGVGQNLQDHLEVYVQVACLKPVTLYKAQWKFPHNMVKIGLEWFMFQTGLGATSHLEAVAFIRSRAGIEHPDIQFHFLPSTVRDHGRINGDRHAYQVHVGPQRSQSRGSIKLRTKNPEDHPLIDPNYLSTEVDRWEMRECIKLAREIFEQDAFAPYRGEEILPGVDVQSDAQLDEFAREHGETAYHPSCSAKMGSENDPMAVVNNRTEVFGMENLHVVDASIMPSVTTGNLNAPVIMLAEKAADIIRGREPLAPVHVPVYQPPSLDTQR
ncbi:choline dehydrogenase, mitochondrial-like isoform X2 [Anneissia japonica]|uniref:choline dehydrogenase, mitochondrial-like isoform X2 n=1 Tax=Anneissia japonica TaxID=1529436 RepID=UPI0014257CF1|nr:choline dehydrogenase, mitochondrial-like isoform X2 [Anneissia japonica]